MPLFQYQPSSNHLELPTVDGVTQIAPLNSWSHGGAAAFPATKIRSVGIIGAGVMGTTIAAAHVQYGVRVVVCDVNPAALAGVVDAIETSLVRQSFDTTADTLAIHRLVQPTSELATAARSDLIIESIAETLAAKQQLFARLQPHLSQRTIVASNTSTIPIAQLAAGMARPQQFCGLHFFHPVQQRPLVEIARGPQTSEHTIATLAAHVQAIHRRPIVVDDGPGFVVNRMLLPYLGEALELLREGVTPETIERVALDFGMAMGPLRLMDEIGLDTTLQAGWVLSAAFPERMVASPLLVTMVKSGQLGCKSGVGFFVYDHAESSGNTATNPALADRIARWALPSRPHTPESITDRLFLPMVLEASRILEESRSLSPDDLDQGAVFGLGFPAARGGLLRWADTLGASEILRRLRAMDDRSPRWQPSPLLLDLARRRGTLYADSHTTRSAAAVVAPLSSNGPHLMPTTTPFPSAPPLHR